MEALEEVYFVNVGLGDDEEDLEREKEVGLHHQ
jgi:hypothetical protein